MKQKGRARSPLKNMDDLNLTPMMDLVFLLLIVFMITTPLLENAIDVTPPTEKAGEIKEDKSKQINLNKDGIIYIDKNPVSKEELSDIIAALKLENPNMPVFLRADGSREYKEVIEVLGIIAKGGFQNVSLITVEP